ncbi:putative aminodeoxychorismate synthase [Neolecta irregularis DAH-3]|uniref:aminodeoxychorismate synthase n=1 Tax=Neolecta irregularis (strain DAH-3) TaxID=1198029 RepID=A0A1U7LSR7_NEOID|nr:putative aminodeoxychorismate synthase [Neolecta irregularis DAH-3]|eukprot:OLL25669.1 putative aminodeoxychorismate synthase [Neolecta irregularis DAH-3]
MSPVPRILLIDSYDSYSYNLRSLLLKNIPGSRVVTIRNDQFSLEELQLYLPAFDSVVIGPGPGNPSNPKDIGVIGHVWNCDIPTLGVCLGMQTLCMAFGGEVKRLSAVKHGQISFLEHFASDIYANSKEIQAVRYHSLHCTLPKDLEALSWADDEENGRVLMGVRHPYKPYWGVQYHPESVCSTEGNRLILNFWDLASNWNKSNRPSRQLECHFDFDIMPQSLPSSITSVNLSRGTGIALQSTLLGTDIVQRLNLHKEDPVTLLESLSVPGRYSLVGVPCNKSEIIQYFIHDLHVTVTQNGCATTLPHEGDIWSWLAKFMAARATSPVFPDIPFSGGLIGYFSYEAGVSSLNVAVRGSRHRPDVNLVFVFRSVVIDTHKSMIYIQSLQQNDDWVNKTALLLQTATASPPPISTNHRAEISIPEEAKYKSNIAKCTEHLLSGNSYELCLTAQTRVLLPLDVPSWSLYHSLRSRNPAPYAAYLRLGSTTVLSSSPERFLSWTRDGKVELRPIKGTIRKTPTTTFAEAESKLRVPKEMAENLMIVDLIRHDLHCITDDVTVPKLMQVEEYRTVFQLVSVIQGQLSPPYTGFDVLSRSLPPGSMTGAPKKRSVEILQTLEEEERVFVEMETSALLSVPQYRRKLMENGK